MFIFSLKWVYSWSIINSRRSVNIIGHPAAIYDLQCAHWSRYNDFYLLLQANRGVFGHQCNLGPILPHLYAKNIVPAQKLPKLQYFKENSSQPCKESFQNFTFNMKEHFFNLSVVELCILHYNGPVSVQRRIYIICKRMHRRKCITVQYSASSMHKANLF